MLRGIDHELATLAAERDGAFDRLGAAACGADDRFLARRLRAGSIHERGIDVFTIAGSPDTLRQRRWVGLLAGGAHSHLSHETAAELHRIAGVRRGLVVVTVPAPHHVELPGVVFHQLRDVDAADLTEVDGFPVTVPARTVMDLAATTSFARLRSATEHVIVERLATYGELGAVLRRVRRRGKPGVRKLVTVLDALGGEPPPASELERLLLDAVRLAGVKVIRQFPLPWEREPIEGLVDAAAVESKLILESDGRSWHTRLADQARDARRDREAARAGWQTLRFVWQDLRDDARSAANDIRTVHRLRTRE